MAGGTFGVTSAGFVRPTLDELIQIEKDSMLAGVPSLTFAAGSPELAIVEARAKAQNADWEARECAFNSFNTANQAGCALDISAKLQGFVRLDGESDADFQARISATESGTGFVSTLETAIGALPDVCRVRVFNNTTSSVDTSTGNPAGSYEVVYQGGDPQAIAQATWDCSTGAINVGNETVRFEDNDGICREVRITQATEVPYCVRLIVDTYQIQGGCTNQTFDSIIDAAFTALSDKSLAIGNPIFAGAISGSVYAAVQGLDIRSIEFAPSSVDVNGDCTCDDVLESDWQNTALDVGHRTIPTFDRDCIIVLARDR